MGVAKDRVNLVCKALSVVVGGRDTSVTQLFPPSGLAAPISLLES